MSFNLADVLKDVSNLDTGREQIEYINLDLIDSDPNNFYQLSGIDELANNIATCGLQQPIRVRAQSGEGKRGRYIIVSGHRRRAAVEMLAKDEPERWREIPCIVERDEVSPALQQLRLIYANSSTRAMTSAELGEQAAQVEKLLYQLKEEGYDFPGRMRDHVAQAVNASKTKLARLKVIRENLAECWKPYYTDGTLSESAAYELARMPAGYQQCIYDSKEEAKYNIRRMNACLVEVYARSFAETDKLKCKKMSGSPCQNAERMRKQAVLSSYNSCSRCCSVCASLATCKNACPLLADKIARLKADKKEARRQEKIAQEEKDRPIIAYIRGVYDRVGKARQASGVSVKALYQAQNVIYAKSDDDKQEKLETGSAKINTNTTLPFGYTFYEHDARHLCAVADLLHCSIDYLLGRADDPKTSQAAPMENVSNLDTWRMGTPEENGAYAAMVQYDPDGRPSLAELFWGGKWFDGTTAIGELGIEVLCWMPLPDLPRSESPLNNACITGISPFGHCGAAHCCSEPYECCLQCPDPCNSRCGWIDENVSNSDTTED